MDGGVNVPRQLKWSVLVVCLAQELTSSCHVGAMSEMPIRVLDQCALNLGLIGRWAVNTEIS